MIDAALERDFNALWNTGYFEDIRFQREADPQGLAVDYPSQRKPTIREINYVGLSSVSTSDVLDRFKERKVGLSVENQYDPTKVKKAEVSIKELLAEHGRQFSTIRTESVRFRPPPSASRFVIKEGPKVKVGKIRFRGQQERRYAVVARRHEELASPSASRTPSSWKTSSPEPTTPPNWKKIRNAFATNTRIAAISKSS
jgi:outer membrane protein assembly factor BamA